MTAWRHDRKGWTGVLFLSAVLGWQGIALAARPCEENFTESGSWSSGRLYQSRIEVEGIERRAAVEGIAQHVALEGYLGLEAKSDLGLVSAYQETNGKRSALNATVRELAAGKLRLEASFRLAPGLRAPAGAVREGLCALLEAPVPAERREAGSSPLLLEGGALSEPLRWEVGGVRQGLALLFEFPGSRAEARVRVLRPAIRFEAGTTPSTRFVLVRLKADPENDLRTVKLGSVSQVVGLALTGKELVPDEDWTVSSRLEATEDGAFRLVAAEDLKPGEYGVWDTEVHALAAFGVDRAER